MKKILILMLSLMTVFFAACGTEKSSTDTSEKNFIEDDLGRKIFLDKKFEKIAVTSASFLEPLHAVGGNIVARPDSKNKTPDWAKDISSIGQVYQIDVERLLSCQPDLVIINKGMNEKLLGVLEENKIPAAVIEMKTYDDVKREVKIFSELTGNVDEGEKIISDMDGEIKSILEKVPQEKKRVAILHSTAQGVTVQLEGSIAGNIIKMFSWENVADGMTPLEKNPDAAPYSLETLAQQNPEIIFVTSMGNLDEIKAGMEQAIAENDAWQTIGAIKSGKIFYLPQDLFLLSPGLHYPDAVKFIADLVASD